MENHENSSKYLRFAREETEDSEKTKRVDQISVMFEWNSGKSQNDTLFIPKSVYEWLKSSDFRFGGKFYPPG